MSQHNSHHYNQSITSPINNKLDWDCQELKVKFPKSKNDISVPIPKAVDCQVLLDGKVVTLNSKPTDITTPIHTQDGTEPISLGKFAMTDTDTAMKALETAEKVYNYGRGPWSKLSLPQRLKNFESFADELEKKTDEIAQLVMWEIGKNTKDAADEVTRTVAFIRTCVKEAQQLSNEESRWQEQKGIICQIRHLPIGVMLASSPFNYPLNEAYTTFIPALMMGNSVIVRAPRNGASPHFPTYELFAKYFPPGTIQILTGSGREVMGALIATGRVDMVAFIGTASSCRGLLQQASNPQRLRVMYEGEAKDAAIVLPDADLSVAVDACSSGMTSFNGQRCTAIKMIWVHESIATEFIKKLSEKIDSLKLGMPWEDVKITPLAEGDKSDYVKTLIDDAISHGAHIVNKTGGRCWRTLCSHTILAPVTKKMKLYSEEQFGPVTPVCIYSDVFEAIDYVARSEYGLQSSVYGYDETMVGKVVDALSYHVGRININAPDQRGPDVFPFSGRGNSALGILNASEGLKQFSIPTMIATKSDDEKSTGVLKALNNGEHSKVLYGAK